MTEHAMAPGSTPNKCAKAAPDLRIMLGCEIMGQTGADSPDEEIRSRRCAEQEDQPSALKVLDVRDPCNNAWCLFCKHKLWCVHGCQESRCDFLLECCGCLLSTLSLKGPRVWQLSPDYQCRDLASAVPHCCATILLPRSGGNPHFVQDPKRHTDHPEKRRGVPHGDACLRQQQATNVVPMRATWALMGRPARLLHPVGCGALCLPRLPTRMWMLQNILRKGTNFSPLSMWSNPSEVKRPNAVY